MITHYIDGYNLDTSSWLRFINNARHSSEENIYAAECKSKIYYLTNKDIYPGQELLVYYGDEYAEFLGIDLDNY